MPHKRNPEASEHLDTLARLVRANAAVMVEAVAQQHERDGRGWKAEWVALPEACLLATAALQITIGLLDGLDVDAGAMRRNLARHGGYPLSERALALVASGSGVGPRQAQERLQDVLASGAAAGLTAERALVSAGLLRPEQARDLDGEPDTGSCQAMTDLIVERARAARAAEPRQWP
jgi:adenylosuccinate lyase